MNLIFCSLDTLRADRLGSLGNSRGLTPNLDRIASEGALFSQCYASDIPTQPSHTALFTGQYGVNTGIVSHFHPDALLEGDTLWLPTLMRKRGFATGAVDHLFAMKGWFKRGYHDYMPPPGRSRSPGSEINEIAFPWIADHSDEDFFLFLHFWDAHIPYVPPSPFKERYTAETSDRVDPRVLKLLQSRPSYPLFKKNLYDFLDEIPNLDYIADLYDAEIAYLDFEIGRLFEKLADEGLLENTLVVLFGDHGENMTEHDSWFDHAGLYDSVTNVPLILWAPGVVPVKETDAFVQLIDVFPTIGDIFDMPETKSFDGRSLMPLLRGETDHHRDVVMLSESTWQASRAIRDRDWKYIKYAAPTIYARAGIELYDLAADPTEQVNVAHRHPDVVQRMNTQLDDWVTEQLGGRTDPMVKVLATGLPAVQRLNDLIAEEAGAGEPTADHADDRGGKDLVSVPEAALVGAVGALALDETEGETGKLQRFSPGGAAPGRSGRRRAVIVGAMVIAALAALGGVANAVLLSGPLAASGTVEAGSTAELNLPTTGTIATIPVTLGQTVHAGQVLATQDTSANQAKLSADQAKLTADQATLTQQQAGGTTATQAPQVAAVTNAGANLAAAQSKLGQTEATTNGAVAAAQSQVQTAQSLLNADQATAAANLPSCVTANPPASCATDQRQVQVDQGNLTTAQSSYTQAVVNEQAQVGAAQATVTQANSAVSAAQAALAAGSAPASASEVSTTQALIQQDQAAIAADRTSVAAAVLLAPFDGVVAAINGTVGEVATDQGVRLPQSATGVSQPSSGGIQIFPQGPQSGTAASPTLASLISLQSLQTKLVVQVPETSISTIRVGQSAMASLPAVPGRSIPAVVTKIEPTPVTQSGQTYFLVDLEAKSQDIADMLKGSGSSRSTLTSAVGFTVDVSF